MRATARRKRDKAGIRDIAGEIVRRVLDANGVDSADGSRRLPYVVRLSEPPTPRERLQLIAVRLTGTPIVIMPHKCATMDEWLDRCRHLA